MLLIPFKKLSFLWAQWKTPDFPKKLGVQRSNPVAIKNLGSHLLFRESPSGDSSLSSLRGQPRSVALRWRWQCAASPQTCDTATRRHGDETRASCDSSGKVSACDSRVGHAHYILISKEVCCCHRWQPKCLTRMCPKGPLVPSSSTFQDT